MQITEMATGVEAAGEVAAAVALGIRMVLTKQPDPHKPAVDLDPGRAQIRENVFIVLVNIRTCTVVKSSLKLR